MYSRIVLTCHMVEIDIICLESDGNYCSYSYRSLLSNCTYKYSAVVHFLNFTTRLDLNVEITNIPKLGSAYLNPINYDLEQCELFISSMSEIMLSL